MTPLIWSPQAQRDLEAIRTYITRDSARYAELMVQRIVAGIERLARFPESGRVVPERSDSTIREVIVDGYRVVYRYRGEAAEIVTVFRGSRSFPTDLT